MMWQYSRLLISEEDFYKASKPKKVLCIFGLTWTGIAVLLRLKYLQNAETVFKSFLITPMMPVFAITPLIMSVWYIKKQSQVYHDIYERTVGHLSDRELLELDMKLNPNKKVVYKYIFD